MAFTYSPVKFTGPHVAPIFSNVLEGNATVSQNLIRFFDNVKGEINVTTMSGTAPFRKYKEDLRESDYATYTDTLSASDKTLTPSKMQSIVFFKMDDLRNTRFGDSMAAGAGNIESPSFESAATEYLMPLYSRSFEDKIWTGMTTTTKAAIAAGSASATQKAWAASITTTADDVVDGLVAQLIVENAGKVAGTTITVANIGAEYDKAIVALPTAVQGNADTVLYAPYSHRMLIRMANKSQTYRDLFVVDGDQMSYLGLPIRFVPLPENCVIAGRGGANGDLVAATELLSDVASFEIGKVNNVGDQLFGKLVVSLTTGVLLPAQKVIYL